MARRSKGNKSKRKTAAQTAKSKGSPEKGQTEKRFASKRTGVPGKGRGGPLPVKKARGILVFLIAMGMAAATIVVAVVMRSGEPTVERRSSAITHAPAGLSVRDLDSRSWQSLDDASEDGWHTEVFTELANKRLSQLGALIAQNGWLEEGLSTEQLNSLVDDSFSSRGFVPRQLETVYEAHTIRVERGANDNKNLKDEAVSYRGSSGFAEALAELVKPFRGARNLRCDFSIFQVNAADETVETRQFVSISGLTEGGSLEQNATWVAVWGVNGPSLTEARPRLTSISVEEFEQVWTNGVNTPLYSDCTQSALEQNACYKNQLLRGYNHWLERTESRAYWERLGTPGLAIGDVNGDGLEDLYLCQERGLPNLLFLQREDGTLRDASKEAGVDWLEDSRCALFIDLDNDGDQDVAVGVTGGIVVAENDGHAKFKIRTVLPTNDDVKSLSAADYDQDARLDLYASVYYTNVFEKRIYPNSLAAIQLDQPLYDSNQGGANSLYRNLVEGNTWRFVDITQQVGLGQNNERYSVASSWGDFDNDGDLDLYVANDYGRNNLYQNDGGSFVDIATETEVADFAFSKSISWSDFNCDGLTDIYVGNTFSAAGNRIISQPRFKPGLPAARQQRYQHLAGGNSLFQNRGSDTFRDHSGQASVETGHWAWSSSPIDINSDGWDDLLVANGLFTGPGPEDLSSFFWRQVVSRSQEIDHDFAGQRPIQPATALSQMLSEGRSLAGSQRNCCFLNTGGDKRSRGEFATISATSGLDFLDDARAIGVLDWDQDGDLDVWITNRNAPRLRLMRNDIAPGNHFVSLKLIGDGESSNRDAIGARVKVVTGAGPSGAASLQRVRTLRAGEGFISQSSKYLHFGLGQHDEVEAILVRWPGTGPEQAPERFVVSEVDRRYELVQGSGIARVTDARDRELALEPSVPGKMPASQSARIALQTLLPSPSFSYRDFGGRQQNLTALGKPLLLTLWSGSCGTCQDHLVKLKEGAQDIREAGIDIRALSVDRIARRGDPSANLGDPEASKRFLSAIEFPFGSGLATAKIVADLQKLHDYLMPIDGALPIPISFLFDTQGRLSVIYKGPVRVGQVIEDKGHSSGSSSERFRRSAALPGSTIGNEHVDDAIIRQEAAIRALFAKHLEEQGDRDRAFTQYREVLKVQPDYFDARYLVGQISANRGDVSLAKEHLQQAIRLRPNHADAHTVLSDVYVREGQLDKAVEHCEAAVRIKPEQAELRVNLGNVLVRQRAFKAAREQYEEALRLNPEFAEASNALGTAWFLDGNLSEAKKYYELAVLLKRDYAEAHFNLGNVFAQSGALDKAKQQFQEALRIRPDYREAQVNLGRVNNLLNQRTRGN